MLPQNDSDYKSTFIINQSDKQTGLAESGKIDKMSRGYPLSGFDAI